jgi:NAD(P)-dependent dehydrogenase (short-subunit alcohol dehydrogenase family)
MRVVVTGANRGIGLELARQLAAREAVVEATARRPEAAEDLGALAACSGGHVRVHACDVSSDQSVERFAAGLKGVPVDVLINNAGSPPVRDGIGAIEPGDNLLETLDVNAVGALRVARALLPNLRAGEGKRIIHLGSLMGSLAESVTCEAFGYRMSKAALNMASRLLAIGLHDAGIASVVVDPGWVRTRMGGPRAMVRAETAASDIINLIEKIRPRHSGQFLDSRGRTLRW